MWACEVPHYLGDGHDGEHVSFAEGKVLLGSAVEVVLGNTFCTGGPSGLQGRQQVGGWMQPGGPSPPTRPPTLEVTASWLASVSLGEVAHPLRDLGAFQLRFPHRPQICTPTLRALGLTVHPRAFPC